MAEDSYLNNPLLKKAFVPIQWTEEDVKEYLKCSKAISYFIRTYVKIIDLDEGLVHFDLYDYQEKIAITVVENRHVIIKTPRQAGKTTIIAAVLLWHVLFNDNYTVAILANKEDTAKEILTRVQRAFENLPKWLQQGVISWNKKSVELENGSRILAASTASSAVRGFSINFLYLDEFAFVPPNIQEDFFNSVYPTIVSGKKTKLVITSTPQGFELFYKLWMDAIEERNNYAHVEVFWSDPPGRDEEWKKATIAEIGEDRFRQEFEGEFIGSSNTLISPNILRRLVFVNPKYELYNHSLKVYQESHPDRTYFITVDTSRGVGIDASAFVVFDLTSSPYEIVATYNDNLIDPLVYPDIIKEVATAYNNCPILVEINDIGQQIADILHNDLEYDNIVFTSVKGRAGQQINGGFSTNIQKGVRTTAQVKRIGCGNARTLIEQDQIILNDFNLIRQLSTFVMKKKSFEAEEGCHDDLVMCVVLLGWATNQDFFKTITDTDFRAKLLSQRNQMLEDDMVPFGFIEDGQPEANPEDEWQPNNDPWNPSEVDITRW